MVRKILWDFDGVILDSFPDQFAWFRRICTVLNKPFPYTTIEEFRTDYREPVYPDMYTFLKFDWAAEEGIIWKEYNAHKSAAKIDLVAGAEELLRSLADDGYVHGVASSNTHDAIKGQLERHELSSLFTSVVGKEDLPKENGTTLIKPHPACVLLGLERLGATPDDGVYVGDQRTDIIACRRVAQKLNRPLPIAVYTRGYGFEEHLREEGQRTIDAWGPESVVYVDSMRSLEQALRSLKVA